MKRAGALASFASFGMALLAWAVPAEAQGSGGGNVSFGASASSNGNTTASANSNAAPADREDLASEQKEWAERESQLNEAATITGGVGLIHTQHAQGSASGQFRVGFTTEYFSAGFLCSREFPCADPRTPGAVITSDSADHIGGRLTLTMQVTKWLEPYIATSAIANSNPNNRPSLLQVLGDSVLGAKAHAALSDIFHVGGAFELWLMNGTGSVGLDGAGTSAKFRGLASADLRNLENRLPLRFSFNGTYVLDNSGELVTKVERDRGNVPITRIERFGLDINRVDHFDFNIGAELFAAEEKVRPFLEYQINVPINRQDYACHQNTNPSNDKCLATDAFAPSSLTLGGRFYPWKHGFNLTAALDIGISGVGFFIEEVRPTPPWMLYLGAGWAFDTVDRPPTILERQVDSGHGSGRRIRGTVHEDGQSTGIANAIVSWENHPELTSLATGSDGSFTTHELPAGPYVFTVHADGYKPGQCTTAVGTLPPQQKGPGSPPPSAGGEIQLDCPLAALPRVGNIVGKVKDSDTNAPLTAAIKIVDSAKRELSGSSDAQGSYRFELVTPGDAQVTVDADGYLADSEKVDVKAREDNPLDIALKKKPKNSLVAVQNKEIIIRQQVQFAVDSATILPASTGLLTEIADVLLKNPRIKRVEVQGHTDGSGTPAHNLKLSEDRSAAVVTWLTSHGVAADRLTAKGYGDSKPIVPNVTELNKARNRRVQFIITDQDPAPAKP